MNEATADVHRVFPEVRANPYVGPYGGRFSPYEGVSTVKDVKKFSSDGEEWIEWPHSSSSFKKKKKSAALSALTLLAFLFFLNLLQTCLKEQMLQMNPTVMVMTASAGRDEPLDGDQRSSERIPERQMDNYEVPKPKRRNRVKKRPKNPEPRNGIPTTIAPKLANSFLQEIKD